MESLYKMKKIRKPICVLCKKVVPAKCSNTTNLFKHLQEHHADVYTTIMPKSNCGIPKQKRQLSVIDYSDSNDSHIDY